ncbi:MAG TPA: asparagine synthetase B, partial [Spirochaetota bacterium]|nr:asparagine synthetase B [Spirochaetota bacterium]
MCGITGIYRIKSGEPVSREELIPMTEALRHRGPDEYGYYINGNLGLGHSRLSIIDLSGSSQPVYNEDKSICVVFNGEIFNYIEL